MDTLTDDQRGQLRSTLATRELELLDELGESRREAEAANARDDSGEVSDFKELAEQVERTAVRDAEAQRDRDELAAVRGALARIDEGSYGECVDCGKDIAVPRLQAQPEAARCIACQERAEAAVR